MELGKREKSDGARLEGQEGKEGLGQGWEEEGQN